MSLLSSLKRMLMGSSKPIPSPAPIPPQPQSGASRVPKVAKPMTVPATTDELTVTLPHQAKAIAPGMVCDTLQAKGSKLTGLPDEFEARIRIDLARSKELKSLPAGLRTGSLNLAYCVSLTALPERLAVTFLDVQGCAQLTALPGDLKLLGGGLNLRDCTGLTSLPDGLGTVASLDLTGCTGITSLPEGLTVTSWMSIDGSGITDIPAAYASVGLRSKVGAPLSREEALA